MKYYLKDFCEIFVNYIPFAVYLNLIEYLKNMQEIPFDTYITCLSLLLCHAFAIKHNYCFF